MYNIIISSAFNRSGNRLYGKFVAAIEGLQLCVSRQPLLDAARVLLGRGTDPAVIITMRHAGADSDALTATVGAAARWTVRENETGGPTFERWKPFSGHAVRAPMRSNDEPSPDTGRDAERFHDADRVSP